MPSGRVECSMLPGISTYGREITDDMRKVMNEVDAYLTLFPYVVCWQAPFWTPDGMDYDWGFVLCMDETEARWEAQERSTDGAGATVSRTKLVEHMTMDHPHTPEIMYKVGEGDTVQHYVDGARSDVSWYAWAKDEYM